MTFTQKGSSLKVFYVAGLLSFMFFAQSPKAYDVEENQIQFKYLTNEGDINLDCFHWKPNPQWNDWEVTCGKGTPWLKNYKVHFLIREQKNSEKQMLEVVFSIIDKTKSGNSGSLTPLMSSQGIWVENKAGSNFKKITLHQSVENDYALLRVEFIPEGLKLNPKNKPLNP